MNSSLTTEKYQSSSDDTKKALVSLVSTVLKIPATNVTPEDIIHFIIMDLGISATDLTISISEKRKTSQQFSTNDWTAAVTVNIKDLYLDLKDAVLKSTDPFHTYIQRKSAIQKFICAKYEGFEDLLKRLVMEAQKKDNIPPLTDSRHLS